MPPLRVPLLRQPQVPKLLLLLPKRVLALRLPRGLLQEKLLQLQKPQPRKRLPRSNSPAALLICVTAHLGGPFCFFSPVFSIR